jgi:hypothetical protein
LKLTGFKYSFDIVKPLGRHAPSRHILRQDARGHACTKPLTLERAMRIDAKLYTNQSVPFLSYAQTFAPFIARQSREVDGR